VPSYPRHRARRVSPAAVELIRHARQEFGYGAARTRLWLQRVHGAVKLLGILSACRAAATPSPSCSADQAPDVQA
jgi:hypothetical protein